MKVSELIQLLEDQDPDAEVAIQQPTHDHWRTQLANTVRGVEVVPVKHSAYHDAEAIEDEFDPELDDPTNLRVLIYNQLP